MQVTGKPSVRKFVETLPNVDMKAKEQRETLDNLIRQTIICDSFVSFTKARENPVQWIHWLDTLDQQNVRKGSRSSKLEVGLEAKDRRQEEILKSNTTIGEGLGTKDSQHSSIKSSNMFGRGLQTSGDRLHALKLPEAMVAIAQAAAKANDLPGWPLMSNKVQMQKCEKCSQEFFSTLNQRRHMRTTHRRPLNVDKEDLKKKKEQVAAYWNKLTPEEACEIVSFKNISLADLSAASIVRALSTHLQQPGLLSLPQSYVRVATTLLDIVQNKPSQFPLPSEELLNILEDASEKNLFCSVTSSSMQRCIFDREPGRVGLETKNLAASLGFLVELRLVKAWMEDKDVEALRCQKVLVEEEEAAQKKRARLQERKRQKKMRQKESKDKDRKGTECSSPLRILKFDPFSRENCMGHGEGDDSPTATQSSPSSSGSSRQDPSHLDSSHIDRNEFESCNGGKAGGKSSRLDDEQQDLDGDSGDQQNGCWPGSDALFPGTADQEELSFCRSSGENDASYEVPMVIKGNTSLQSSSYGSLHADLQNVFSDRGGETGRSFMQFRTSNGKFIPERKSGGWGWKGRKQIDVNAFPSYQKQPCSYERRYHDYSHGGQKFSRKPYNVPGNSAPEFSGVSLACNATPRYSQHREKYSGVKRPSSSAGSGHAVWARKTPQNSGLESEQPDGKSNSNNLGIDNGSVEIAVARQLKDLPSEDACTDVANSSIVAMCSGDSLSDSCHVNTENLERLSCDSLVSFDSVTSFSSSSVGMVEAEEQAINEEMRVSLSFSDQASSGLISKVDLAGRTAGDLNIASGAVVIGTLKISLGDPWPNVLEHTSYVSNSQETLKRVSGDVKNLPEKKQKADIHGENDTCVQAGKIIVGTASSINVDIVSKGLSDCLQEIGTRPLDLSRESSAMMRDGMFRQVADVESPHLDNSFTEKVAKQGPWPNGTNKLGHIKIWRPITVGEHNDSQTVSSLCVVKTAEEQGPVDTNNSDVLCQDAGGIGPDSGSVGQSQFHVRGSGEDASCLLSTGKTRGDDQEAADLSCTERSHNSPYESDVSERGASCKERSGHHCTVGDGVEPSNHSELKTLPLFRGIASFLSQRWADAITFSDSIDMATHLKESDDFLVKSISRSFSSPLTDEGILGHCRQVKERVLHRGDHYPEFDTENAGCTTGLSCEDSNS